MIKRIITDEIKAEAMRYAKELTNIAGKSPCELSGGSINQHYIGRIGELIFKGWLVEHHIKGYNPNKADGCSDDYDFMLEGSDKTIDVKTDVLRSMTIEELTSDHPTFINANQVESKLMDYYVIVKLDNDYQQAYIIGYISRNDVINNYKPIQTVKMPAPAYLPKIRDFSDIRELIFDETGKCIDGYVKPPKQYSIMDCMNIDLSTLPKNTGKVKNLSLMDYTSEYMASLPKVPKVKQSLMDY